MASVVCPPITYHERDLELDRMVVEQVGAIEEEEGRLSLEPPIVQLGKGFCILGVLSLIASVGLWFLG